MKEIYKVTLCKNRRLSNNADQLQMKELLFSTKELAKAFVKLNSCEKHYDEVHINKMRLIEVEDIFG